MARTSKAARPIEGSIPGPNKISVELVVNDVLRRLTLAPWTTLLDALRDHLNLTGTKKAATMASAALARCWLMAGASIRV